MKHNPFLPKDDPETKERAHSKYSASGSERWLNCSYSVAAEESSPPSKDNVWSIEGTVAHSVYEAILKGQPMPTHPLVSTDMINRVTRATQKVKALHRVYGGALLVEKRVFAQFIHAEMFGTTDTIIAPVAPLNGVRTLHVLDFKDGAGHIVSPVKNTQLVQYALSVAEDYGWELCFDEVKMWILQPRAGDNWYPSWTITIKELKESWLPLWHKGVARVEKGGGIPFPGSWCHWCRASKTCPAKNEKRVHRMTEVFNNNPIPTEINQNGKTSGVKGTNKESSSQGRQENKNGQAVKWGGAQGARQKSKGGKDFRNAFKKGKIRITEVVKGTTAEEDFF